MYLVRTHDWPLVHCGTDQHWSVLVHCGTCRVLSRDHAHLSDALINSFTNFALGALALRCSGSKFATVRMLFTGLESEGGSYEPIEPPLNPPLYVLSKVIQLTRRREEDKCIEEDKCM